MDADIAQLCRHPSRQGRAPPRPTPALLELTRRHGPLLPVLVRALGARRYEILANIEVWLAAQACGLHRVPIEVVPDLDEAGALEILAATDRRPRPLDAARRYARLVEAERRTRAWGATTRVARRCDVPRTEVARALRVLGLPALVLEALELGALRLGHAYALLACADEEARLELASRAIGEKLSVRVLERLARERGGGGRRGAEAAGPPAGASRDPDVVRLERHLTAHLGSPVRLDEHGGTLTIDYGGSLEVLDGLLGRLGAGVS